MGVFSGQIPEMQKRRKEICRHDYEGEINRLNKQKDAASNLLDAIDEYCDYSFVSGECTFTLNGLIGGLIREMKQLEKNIEVIQEEWESFTQNHKDPTRNE